MTIAFFLMRAGEELEDIGSRDLYENHPVVHELYHDIHRWTDIPVAQLLDDEVSAEPGVRHSILGIRSIALHLALSDLLEDAGIRPDVAVGLSLGFTSASCIAGALDRRDAFRMHWQSRMRQETDQTVAFCWIGSDVSADRFCRRRRRQVHVAADFGLSPDGKSRMIMFAGHAAGMAALMESRPDVKFVIYPETRAVHTPLHQQGSELFRSYLSAAKIAGSRIPVTACLDPGLLLRAADIREALCGNQVRSVKVAYGMSEIARSGARLCISLGPTRVDRLMRFPCPVLRVASTADVAEAVAAVKDL